VLSTSTDESSAQSVMSWASRVRSLSVLPKPSQSMKASSGLPSPAPSSEPQSHRPSVQARVVLPIWKSGSPRCTRSSSRFRM